MKEKNKDVCRICGKEFKFWHSQAKTCGKECSKKYSSELKRLYRLNNREKTKEKGREYYYKHRKLKEKICKICGKSFYLRGSKAKTCSEECRKINIRINRNRNSKIWVRRHPEKRKEITRQYSIKNKAILNKKSREWHKKNPQKGRESTKRWRKANPEKRNAQARAQNNIKIPEGQLCVLCNIKKAIDRHHEDYSKPLDVQFLCRGCHLLVHRNKKI